MTINQVIELVDSVKPNACTQEQKLRWVNELDGKVHEEVIKTHEGWDGEEFVPYDDMEQTLLIPFPHDGLYASYITAQIDLVNGDISRYNNSITVFQAAYSDFAAWYNRTHMPTQRGGWKVF